jgi:TetR/AcrR family transcriptional regulator, transcriptional repressor for nem operon
MSAKPTKGELTRREIVRKAAPLFNRKGFEGTSLSDLMQATRLQKGGIYRHFSGKQQLAAEAFDYSWEKAVAGRLEGVADLANSVQRLKKMIDNFVEKREGLVPGGCPLMNTAVESDDGNPHLRARAKKALQSWTARLSKIAAEGIARREINPRIKPLYLAQLIISSLEGALLLSRLQNSNAPLRNIQLHLHHHLDHHVRS